MDAIWVGSDSVAEVLLADPRIAVDQTDTKGRTALHYTAINYQPATARLLLEKGANKTLVNNYGRTPAEEANFYGNSDVAEIIEHF